jgi:hypothetical protein
MAMAGPELTQRTTYVYEPFAAEGSGQDALAPRFANLDGKVIGLLNNNLADVLLEAENLPQQTIRARFREFRKEGDGMAPDLIEEMVM